MHNQKKDSCFGLQQQNSLMRSESLLIKRDTGIDIKTEENMQTKTNQVILKTPEQIPKIKELIYKLQEQIK